MFLNFNQTFGLKQDNIQIKEKKMALKQKTIKIRYIMCENILKNYTQTFKEILLKKRKEKKTK